MRRGRVFILLAMIILLGVAAAWFLLKPGEPAEPTPPPEGYIPPDMVYVAIAAQDMNRGSFIPDDGVVTQQMPADLVVETMIAGSYEQDVKAQVVGKRARMDIARGVPITEGMITEEAGDLLGTGSDASIAIEQGYTAITIPMNRYSGVAYALRPGDTVDVIISLFMMDIDEDFQTRLPNFVTPLMSPGGTIEAPAPSITGYVIPAVDVEGIQSSVYGRVEVDPDLNVPLYVVPQGQPLPRLVTQRLVAGATVLHIGTFSLDDILGLEPAAPVPEQGVGAPETIEGEEVPAPPPVPDLITLVVTPQDALALNWANHIGADLILTLRAPGDLTVEDTISVTLQYLIDNYNIAIPAKLPYGTEDITPVLP
jgi:Flp pilus assembly protein CpaB